MKLKSGIIAFVMIALTSQAQAGICEKFSQGKVYIESSLLAQAVSANHASFRGLHPRFSLGYADWSNRYYIAAELFYLPFTMVLSDQRGNGDGPTAKISNSFGFSIIPGTWFYQNLLGYLRLGLISSRFVAPNSSKLGAQLGLGLQTLLTQQLALHGEYIYTGYSSVSKIGTPNSNELGVGLSYYFL